MNSEDFFGNRQKLLGVILLGLGLVVYMRFLLGPALGNASQLGSEIKVLRQDIRATNAALSRRPQIEAEVLRLREKSKVLEARFPSKSELPDLLERLSDVAERADVEIVEITPSRPDHVTDPATSLYQELPILMTAKTGYHELGVFLNQLENSERIFAVKDMQIRSDGSDQKRHQVYLMLETFVRGTEHP